MRRSFLPAAALVAAMAGSVILAPTAFASQGPKDTGGDNGTAKIHDARTGEELMKNEPHVCTFYLDGFKFDGAQKVDWSIEGQAPTKDLKGTTGSLVLDGTGHERTADLSLPDGHYKLTWKFDNEKGNSGKHKVFWVDCEGETTTGGTTGEQTTGGSATGEQTTGGSTTGEQTTGGSATGEQTTGGSTTGEQTTGGSTTGEQTTGGSTTGGTTATGGASTGEATGGSAAGGSDTKGEGNLAETGSSAPVGIIGAAALALAAAGAVLVTRRRRAQQD
ncbi:LPXTG-motif cell wall-anchored protein [Streptomyces sp. PanSC19]|uniref:LPXTG cell wall anchor domain-containing protein n=1 Tax=Streptomyces sp. PanSC19 TaxID=1520455 RepID=UPI000FB4CA5F|nr:LPXTG cell wall anchor domain-containing protein [Streptomyces sp. PanSC19]ROQ24629.1 LPXTG-motif cell wall-anchored protein [Streptomyces sp. PanSC19]